MPPEAMIHPYTFLRFRMLQDALMTERHIRFFILPAKVTIYFTTFEEILEQ